MLIERISTGNFLIGVSVDRDGPVLEWGSIARAILAPEWVQDMIWNHYPDDYRFHNQLKIDAIKGDLLENGEPCDPYHTTFEGYRHIATEYIKGRPRRRAVVELSCGMFFVGGEQSFQILMDRTPGELVRLRTAKISHRDFKWHVLVVNDEFYGLGGRQKLES